MDERLIPPRYRVLSGSALKVLATLSMFVDHSALVIPQELGNTVLFNVLGRVITPYYVMRTFGRIAFPIFCFLLVEGFLHTRDRRAYGMRLALFALVSEVPWDLWCTGSLIWLGKQSVFVTLSLSYLGLCALERLQTSTNATERTQADVPRDSGPVRGAGNRALLLSDYGVKGLGCVYALYLLRG